MYMYLNCNKKQVSQFYDIGYYWISKNRSIMLAKIAFVWSCQGIFIQRNRNLQEVSSVISKSGYPERYSVVLCYHSEKTYWIQVLDSVKIICLFSALVLKLWKYPITLVEGQNYWVISWLFILK